MIYPYLDYTMCPFQVHSTNGNIRKYPSVYELYHTEASGNSRVVTNQVIDLFSGSSEVQSNAAQTADHLTFTLISLT